MDFSSPLFIKYAILACALLFSCIFYGASSSPCHSGDLVALRNFAGTLTNGSILLSWPGDDACCLWDGVCCSQDSNAASNLSRVTHLLLPNRGLEGSISPALSNLDELLSLDLSSNLLSGSIPLELSLLRRLNHLDLSHNALSGPVTAISAINTLQSLKLSSNFFKASLTDLGVDLLNLIYLNISNNSFYGSLTPSICIGSTLIQVADISMNSFSGELDGNIFSNCSASLKELNLGSNFLTGSLPDSLFDLISLQMLSLSFNNFSCGLSERLNKLSELRRLIISGNRFSGELPDVFGNLSMLEQLIADSNSFSGELPRSVGDCFKLKYLDLRNNSLTGSINIDFSGLTLLTTLDLASNNFEGDLPSSLCNCQQLRILSFAKNRLSGEIPKEYAKLESLSFVSLSNNSFHDVSGAMAVFQSCKNLSALILTKNFHGELIPELSYDFRNLSILALGNCALFGKIPFWLTNCINLQVLDLSWNHLSGTIPPWMGRFDRLIYLDISNNSLSGKIPKSFTELKSLKLIHAYINPNSMSEPLYVKHNRSVGGLQYNQISGFPPAIYLNDNEINGTIWPEFGQLKALHVLDLSNNHITGTIPETISNMQNLEILDLSSNALNGTIPSSLSKLTFLSKFNVAHNNLHGEIPTGGQFFSFSNSSFEGNPGLCRASDPCIESSVGVGRTRELPAGIGSRIGKSTILGIIISVAIGIVVLLGVILLNLSSKEVGGQGEVEDEVEEGSRRSFGSTSKMVLFFQGSDSKDLTINDLLRATNGFDQANIIGCGGFGLVYKAYLPDGTKAAIKKLTGDCGQMEREFRAEVEALSRAQHKNLVSLKGYCRYGDDRLLIYSFMENGSLDYWLHERMDGGCLLSWKTRLKIAQGSARGLQYLHKVCQPNIIHRDVKSSNILLDERFEAHLADFGLSRLIRPHDTHVTTELVGTLGYIPPEYSQTLIATPKGDVFSFGVVIMELLTGRRPVDVCKGKGCRNLVSWVFQMRGEGKVEMVFDETMWRKEDEDELMRVLHIAFSCVSADPKQRPSIDEVVLLLDRVGSD
ncbi:phytosulfokine receptor 2 [Phalaenopsis equestris]|uniref:phytosulfokine receptor 2 n=1 Tax=Phalaenopsis equestris TaxID=78828 RepID=UPI0009E5C8E9|nr:phytosulfokine receptor 2 [Phalaenopsis equestris]